MRDAGRPSQARGKRYSPGDKKRPYLVVIQRCCQIAAAIDLLFFVLFYAVGSPLLAWINIVSIAMYAAAYMAATRGRQSAAVCLIWAEVLGHAALGTLMVGWDSGFHYYLLMFIPGIFVSTRGAKAVLVVFALWSFYVALNATSYFVAPIEPLQPVALVVLRYFNISVVFAMFSYLTWYYFGAIVAAQKRLSALAMTDPLTGLYNRRYIMELAGYEAVQQKRLLTNLAVLIVDIDFFKAVNDSHGHEAGDSVIVAVGEVLKSSIREQDSAARWSGEEFLIVLPDTNLDAAAMVAERIRANVAALAIPHGAGTLEATVTLGVASYRLGETIGATIARADAALYKGKNGGRDRVETG
ncbi:GGDEF domain-containing protein [Massilia glaciei]|uniref:diguanylate cyclase n=1 Tax=Massilia glaciei TaxID=1524097 RepID=A0A2U2I4M9_9BURK|nr:GGDEF domain-containing protein [Massilia glaciei]PWF54711.1 GGDEF domain-containing protein [Massilia glaciei]